MMSLPIKQKLTKKEKRALRDKQKEADAPFDLIISFEQLQAWDEFSPKNIPAHWNGQFVAFLGQGRRVPRKPAIDGPNRAE